MSLLEIGAVTDTKEGKVFAKFDPHWLSNRARGLASRATHSIAVVGLAPGASAGRREKDNATEADPDAADASLCPASVRDSLVARPPRGQAKERSAETDPD